MKYLPARLCRLRFWPAIDSALRAAACTRQVKLRILVSCWDHSPTSMFPFLQSLLILSREPLACDIEVVREIQFPWLRLGVFNGIIVDLKPKSKSCCFCAENLYGPINKGAEQDPLCTSQSCQVHGHRPSGVHRYADTFQSCFEHFTVFNISVSTGFIPP